MKVRITGHTKEIEDDLCGSLGSKIYTYYKSQGHDVKGFSSGNSLEEIIEQSKNCDIFFNNAYCDSNLQLKLLNALHDKVDKMVVSGSVVTEYPDPNDPVYTNNKKILEQRFMELAINKLPNVADLLLLKLTSSSYKNSETIMNTVDFWIQNPTVISLTFNITDNINIQDNEIL